jgi:hypothetical protein
MVIGVVLIVHLDETSTGHSGAEGVSTNQLAHGGRFLSFVHASWKLRGEGGYRRRRLAV